MSENEDYSDGPIWNAFGLTRASYAVFPRRSLQSMPAKWQQRFVDLIVEMHAALPDEALDGEYSVNLRSSNGRFEKDWRANYRHEKPFPRRKS